MIDLHTHILPGIDDGAKTEDDSAQITNALYYQGIRKVFLTPHFYSDQESIIQFIEKRNGAFENCMLFLNKGIEYVLGAEVYLTKYLFSPNNLPHLKELCLNGGNHMLVELPYSDFNAQSIQTMIEKLKAMNFYPILAHPERYMHEKGINKLLDILKAMGVMVQINAADCLEKGMFKMIKQLIKNDFCHFLASDAHNMSRRAPKMTEALQVIELHFGKEWVSRLKNARLSKS